MAEKLELKPFFPLKQQTKNTTMTTKDLLRWKDVGRASRSRPAGSSSAMTDCGSISYRAAKARQRGKWTVSAIHFPKNRAHNGKATRVTISLPNCSRDEAADKALAELIAILKT